MSTHGSVRVQYLALLVGSTSRANPMRQFHLVTLRTLHHPGDGNLEMRPAHALSGLGCSMLRYSHHYTSLSLTPLRRS